MRHKALLAFPLLLALLIPTAGAASPTPGVSLLESLGLASLAILFSLTLVALAYMLGEVLRIESLKKWYRGELWETAKSAIIVISVFAILVIASGIADALAGQPASFTLSGNAVTASNQITTNFLGLSNTAGTYIQNENDWAGTAFDGLFGLTYGVDLLKSFSFSLYVPIPLPIPIPDVFFGFMFGSNANLYTSSVMDTTAKGTSSFIGDYISFILLPLLIIFSMQYQYFSTIIFIGLSLFLPLGIILRAVPILRPLGGTFIAIGIGLALVYPALLVALNTPVTNFVDSIFSLQASPAAPSLPGVLGIFTFVFKYVYIPAGSFLTGFGWGLSSLQSVFGPLNYVSYTLIDVLTQFLLLIFDLVLGLVITGDIAKLLGGRLPTGIGKFKIA